MNKLIKFLFLGLFMLTIVSCCACRVSGSKQATMLLNTKWQVDEMYADELTHTMSDSYTLIFDTKKGSVFGRGDSNRYFASYTMENKNSIKFSAFGSTKMACEGQATETKFFSMLKSVNGFIINDGELMLLSDGNVTAVLQQFQKE